MRVVTLRLPRTHYCAGVAATAAEVNAHNGFYCGTVTVLIRYHAAILV